MCMALCGQVVGKIHSGNVGNKWQRIQEIYKPKAVRA